MSANADTIRRGLLIEVNGISDWQGWNWPILHMWYVNDNNEDVAITGNYGSVHASWLRNLEGNSQLWFYTFSLDEEILNSKDINIIVNADGKDGDKWNRISTALSFTSDKKITITGTSDDGASFTVGEVPYYFIDSNLNKLATLSKDENKAIYTGSFTNTATGDMYAILAPEYAIGRGDNNTVDAITWDYVYRPSGNDDTVIDGFVNYPGELTGTNKTFKFSAAASYMLSFDLTSKATYSITPYFERVITDGYATFSSDYAVAIPEGVTAYYASSAEVGKVNMKKFNSGIPANQGAFLEVTTDGTYKFTPATTTDAITTNLLKKGTSSGLTASTEGKYHYVFAMQNEKLCFYNVAQDIDADLTGKAYLETTTSIKPTNGAPILANFGGEDGTTGINSLTPALSEGKGVYTLDGRKLNVMPSAKGIYIVNGKKVIVK